MYSDGADARDFRAGAVQRVRDLAGHHVDFVARGERHDNIGRGGARRFEHGWIGRVTGNGADVEAVLQVAQHLFVGVDDRDLVRFFAGQVVSRCATDLPGAEYHDLHGGGIVAARMEPATRTAPERLPDGALRFTVRFSPPSKPRPDEGKPNNLNLSGAGTVTVNPEEAVFADSRCRRPGRRAPPVQDGGHRECGLRRGDNAWSWCARAATTGTSWPGCRRVEDAFALLTLLPRTTTPEFVEAAEPDPDVQGAHAHAGAARARDADHRRAQRLVFVVMLLAGAGFTASDPECAHPVRIELRTAHLER